MLITLFVFVFNCCHDLCYLFNLHIALPLVIMFIAPTFIFFFISLQVRHRLLLIHLLREISFFPHYSGVVCVAVSSFSVSFPKVGFKDSVVHHLGSRAEHRR